MERKLLTKRGRTLYKKRGQIVEPVFGQIKTCRGILKFMRRGFEVCAQEWKLICATHNLLKGVAESWLLMKTAKQGYRGSLFPWYMINEVSYMILYLESLLPHF
jgi:hypothetical protein